MHKKATVDNQDDHYKKVFENVTRLQTTMLRYCFDCFRARRRDRRLKSAIMDRYHKNTDVRQVIRTVVDMRILLKNILTPAQLSLFRYQRERLIRDKKSERSSSSSDSSSDSDASS